MGVVPRSPLFAGEAESGPPHRLAKRKTVGHDDRILSALNAELENFTIRVFAGVSTGGPPTETYEGRGEDWVHYQRLRPEILPGPRYSAP